MSTRDDLADLIEVADANTWDKTTPVPNWCRIADAILAAGWRPPARKIETIEELEALPEESLVRDADGVYLTKDYESWYTTRADDPNEVELPAIVLGEPEADDE